MIDAPLDCFNKNGYDIGFCSCFKDPAWCLATYCCPCIVIGMVTGEMEGGSFNIISCCCGPLGIYRNRRNIQAKFDLVESQDGSMLAAACCPCCAVTQDAHEWNKRKPATQGGAGVATEAPVTAEAPTK